jgi:glycosyltransferase involved in cell wall biosynthesis
MGISVCLMSQLFFPNISGGIERYTYYLSESLAEMGVEVHVVTLGSPGRPKYEEMNGVKIHRTTVGGGDEYMLIGLLPMARLAKKLCDVNGIDIIHGHTIHLSDSLLPKSSVNASFIETIHATLESEVGPLRKGNFFKLLNWEKFLVSLFTVAKTIERHVVMRADGLLAVSKSSKRAAVTSYGIDENRVKVVYIGVPLERFDVDQKRSEALRRKLQLGTSPTVLYVGRHCTRKRPEMLIHVLHSLKGTVPGLKLVIVGRENRYTGWLRQLAKALGVGDSVIFPGYVSEEELPDYYAACDVYVLTSMVEGLGISLIEAMASGTPVVAPNTSALPEVLEHGKSGFLFNNFNELVEGVSKLVSDGRLARRMGSSAKECVKEKFTSEKMARETLDFYKGVLGLS